MEEREFIALADQELARLEQLLEDLLAADGGDFDIDIKPGGIIEIDCEEGGRIIINRHVAAREIWLAANSGGYHFKPPAAEQTEWVDTRSAEALSAALKRCLREQGGVKA